jgi:hypothetical protein
MSELTPLPPDLQQKAQKLREQVQTHNNLFDGADLSYLLDALTQIQAPSEQDMEQIGAQLSSIAETIHNALPDTIEAGELATPLLEALGELLGSLGDFTS